jgi:hypothetical protein
MIEILLGTLKDYKFVTSINPLFEIALLKLVALFDSKAFIEEEKPELKEIKIQPANVDEDEEEIEEPIKVVTPIKEEVKVVQEEISQPSLFDFNNEDLIKYDPNILTLVGVTGEDIYKIDDDLMINVMVLAKKDLKNEFLDNWDNIRKLNTHPKYGRAAMMLSDSHPLVVNNKVLIIETGIDAIADKMNAHTFQNDLQTVVNTVFNKKMFVYTVSRKESVRLQQKYINLRQLSKLPKADTIALTFKGE